MKFIENPEIVAMPVIGDRAPEFRVETTHGSIYFPCEYYGEWAILFFQPSDFHSEYGLENVELASIEQEFRDINCELIGLSFGSLGYHQEWSSSIRVKIGSHRHEKAALNFPLIANTSEEIFKRYGILENENSDPKATRAVFFIGPDSRVRGMIHYPVSIGFNLAEIKRVIIALQKDNNSQHSMTSNLNSSYIQVKPTAECFETVVDRATSTNRETESCDCFFCTSSFI